MNPLVFEDSNMDCPYCGADLRVNSFGDEICPECEYVLLTDKTWERGTEIEGNILP
ncbi:MAG: hypothetical protein ACOC1K_05055 [Nanoarchaeota archaeon]